MLLIGLGNLQLFTEEDPRTAIEFINESGEYFLFTFGQIAHIVMRHTMRSGCSWEELYKKTH